MHNHTNPLSVKSSQILQISHDPTTKTLRIKFKPGKGQTDGPVYEYAGVDAEAFDKFKGAESIGSHFYKHLKGKHPHTKL